MHANEHEQIKQEIVLEKPDLLASNRNYEYHKDLCQTDVDCLFT